MIERSRKIPREPNKDYDALVDFPVEIVGRDGSVRRYSFEESVRLYQRRIASASLRYEDGEVAEAEIQHCRRRIEQHEVRRGRGENTTHLADRGDSVGRDLLVRERAHEKLDLHRVVVDEDGANFRGHDLFPCGKSLRITEMRWSRSTGLVTYSMQPASLALLRSSWPACAVMATTGTCAVEGLALIRRVASQPSMRGSDKSIRMRSGMSRVARSTPASPSSASRSSNSLER
jgi:hypothetical protein